jgi:hypothetical protein
MPTQTLVEPETFSSDADARWLLRQRWLDHRQVEWLLDALRPLSPSLQTGNAEEAPIVRTVRCLLREVADGDTGATALCRFVASVYLECGEHPDSEKRQRELQEFVAVARQNGVDFEAALIAMAANSAGRVLLEVGRALFAVGAVDPSKVVRRKRLTEDALQVGAFPKEWGHQQQEREDRDPAGLLFWLHIDVSAALAVAERILELDEEPDVALHAKGILWALGAWGCSTHHPVHHHHTSYADRGDDFARGTQQLLAVLSTRCLVNPQLQRSALFTECLLRLSWMAFDRREAKLPRELRPVLVDLAQRELGRMRAALRNQDSSHAHEFLTHSIDHIEAASRALFTMSSLWSGMKALLLLVRASPVALFADDLSWWRGAPPTTNTAAASLASHLMYSFQAYARFEQANDKQLCALRTELARFCLERCQTNKRDTGPNEPDAIWRVAALRAVAELGVNPDGKGHQVLHHVQIHDGDADVRTAATAAYPKLREARPLPAGMSPRRAILHALWWLRQAHLLSLGVAIDTDGAQRTRAEEARITTRGAED